MTIEEAIREWCGVRIGRTAADGKMRKFRIDQLRNGFLIKIDGAGVFGSVIDGEAIIWAEMGFKVLSLDHKENKDIRHEWLIWHAASSMIEHGERLNVIDRERLALAVERLEGWL